MSQEYLTNLQLLYEKQSEFANIKLYETEDKRIMLVIDTFIQFIEGEDEKNYHEAFISPCKKSKNGIKNILIGGGGDGCLARDLFKLSPSFNITLVDLDEDVINLCKTESRLLKLNEKSLFKCNIIIYDIKKFVLETSNKYDAIFLDLPDPNGDELKKLYSQSFISSIPLILKPNGLFVMQAPTRYRKRVLGLSKKYISKDSESFIYEMPFLGEGSFIHGFNERSYCVNCNKLLCLGNKSGKCNLCNLEITRSKITAESIKKIKKTVTNLWKNSDYRKKQIIAHKGISFYNSGQFKKGVSSSFETQFKKGEHASLKTEFKSGKDHIGYIDGRSFEKYPREFNDKLRNKIRKRDNYTCQNCSMTQEEHFTLYKRDIEVHHIDYNKQNCKEENLITLCKKCNLRVNFNRDYWEIILGRKI